MSASTRYWFLRELPSVELTRADYITQKFSPHWHQGFAVGIVTRNASGFESGGREWIATQGDVILLNPLQIHDGYSLDPRGWSERAVYLGPEAFSVLCGCSGTAWPRHFPRPVIHDSRLAELFLTWHEQAETHSADACLQRDVFAALMAYTVPGQTDSSLCYNGEDDDRIVAELSEAVTHGDSSITALSQECDLTRFGYWRRVKAKTGLAPKPLLKHIRILKAKQWLAAGKPIIDVAHECGFHDQSHFTKQFIAAFGFSPAQFRTAHRAGSDKSANG